MNISGTTCYRHGFIEAYAGQGSSIDHDRPLTNYRELLAYLPRAAFLALASPVPRLCAFVGGCETTSPGGDVKRAVVAIEMLLFYVVALGGVMWLKSGNDQRRSVVWGILAFAIAVSMSYVLASPNEGALYRARFPELVLLWVLGVGGWASYLRQRMELKS